MYSDFHYNLRNFENKKERKWITEAETVSHDITWNFD